MYEKKKKKIFFFFLDAGSIPRFWQNLLSSFFFFACPL